MSAANITVTKSRADELIHFLHSFSVPGRQFRTRWSEDILPQPYYPADVLEFFQRAGMEWWMDATYDPSTSAEMLDDEQRVMSADINSIKTMLTFCVRGERFADGFWGSILEDGRLLRLLRRLEQIRSTLPDSP